MSFYKKTLIRNVHHDFFAKRKPRRFNSDEVLLLEIKSKTTYSMMKRTVLLSPNVFFTRAKYIPAGIAPR